MKFTGLEIICVLDLKGLIFQDIGKILKKKKTNLILQHAPALFFSWLILQAATALFLFLGLPEPPLSICF